MKKHFYYKALTVLMSVSVLGFLTSCGDDDVTADGLVASFTATVDGKTVTFTNISTGATTYNWDFGDESGMSVEENPVYTYENPGSFNVTLTASNDAGDSKTFTEAVVVDAGALLHGGSSKTWYLIGDVSTNKFPYTVQPTDNSVFWWAFGANVDLCVRECIMDDTWTFNSDGTFDFENNGDFYSSGGAWNTEECFDADVAANWVGKDGQDLTGWDSGTHDYAYDVATNTITVNGGFIGLHNATPDGEVSSPAASITYDVVGIDVSGAVDTLIVEVVYANGDSPTGLAYWRSTLVSYENAADVVVTDECPGVAPDVAPTAAAPAPTRDAANVVAIYSDAYTVIDGVNTNPNWGQATAVTGEVIGNDNHLRLGSFNYQGIDFAGNVQDVSGMTHVHVDMYTTNASAVNFFLISEGPAETPKALEITSGEWVGYDIPLTDFSSVVDLSKVIQFKLDGGDGVEVAIYLDNIYFYSE